ncbi:transglycosylase domain-containing protein [Thermopolyspora sp. NPDC052614]|uniref:transglycosylase domain-containing protein n=1 Tax=Thermopolyspora sp. NPDC052614 TaxID=3155682 RepID=UPI00341681C5
MRHGSRRADALGKAGTLGLTAALGGVVAAAVALPVAGGAAITVKNGVDALVLGAKEPRERPLRERVVLLDRGGRPFAQFYASNRRSVPLDQVAPVMRRAIVAVEDERFYEHGGIDLKGVLRAMAVNALAGRVRQGGSSLTQQLVKNIQIEGAESEEERRRARAPSLQRKISEMRYALGLERKYTKDEILERYLNIAYFGAGAFGVEAAAHRFFGTSAALLTLPQAATLAGAVHTPFLTDPALGPQRRARLRERRDLVLDRMAKLGVVTAEQAREARRSPLGLHMRAEPGGCYESAFPYFCVYVYQELLTNPIFGATAAERRARLTRGGLVIRTTLNRAKQRAAERAIAARVHPTDPQVAAEAMVRPGTGGILAIAASKRYGPDERGPDDGHGGGAGSRGGTDAAGSGRRAGPHGPGARPGPSANTSYNLGADQRHGGGMGFQAGSIFKVFTLATALSQGWRFNQGFATPGRLVPAKGYIDCQGRKVGTPGVTVRNADGRASGRPYSLSTGTWRSVNIFYMMLERKVGLCAVVRTARALGVRRADGGPLRQVPTFTLGVDEVDPVTVAAAFAAFAARGRYCRPTAITEIVARDGTRTRIPPVCRRALRPKVADAVNHVLRGVFTRGTMRGQGIGRPVAGKTGTTDGNTAAWFAGYTPRLAAAVSLGDIRGAYRHPLRGVTIGGRWYGRVQGATLPGPIWADSMRAALRHAPPTRFRPPDMRRFGGGHTPKTRPGRDSGRDWWDRLRRALGRPQESPDGLPDWWREWLRAEIRRADNLFDLPRQRWYG